MATNALDQMVPMLQYWVALACSLLLHAGLIRTHSVDMRPTTKIVPCELPLNKRFHNLIGETFGRLKVLSLEGRTRKAFYWKCICECGGSTIVEGSQMVSGHIRSCGCLWIEVTKERASTHGMTNSREYSVWCNMQNRCKNPNIPHYDRYGGRGITICQRWDESFEQFIGDMGRMPDANSSIERNDNDGNYEPSNCRWATPKEQARNRRSSAIVSFDGESLCIAEWAERLGLSYHKTRYWLKDVGIGVDELREKFA